MRLVSGAIEMPVKSRSHRIILITNLVALDNSRSDVLASTKTLHWQHHRLTDPIMSPTNINIDIASPLIYQNIVVFLIYTKELERVPH